MVKTKMKTDVPRAKGSESHEWPGCEDAARFMDKYRAPMSPGVEVKFPMSKKPMRNRKIPDENLDAIDATIGLY
jgi:hypothetical protein